MALFCSGSNAAQRIYRKRTVGVALVYVGLFFAADLYARRYHPAGARLFLAALLPTMPIIGMLYVVGRYLHEEKDEFVRDQFIRSALWAIAALMAYIMFVAFLRSFGWNGATPLFGEGSYRLRNRAANDE